MPKAKRVTRRPEQAMRNYAKTKKVGFQTIQIDKITRNGGHEAWQ
jgi:hypothetical protein